MIIRKATAADVPEIFSFVEKAIARMNKQGIPQWDELYPTSDDFFSDVSKNQLYVAVSENKFAACFTLNKDCDEAYKNGNWSYNGDDFLVLHRLCVNPEFQNRGIGRFVCLEIETIARQKNCQSIKLDCFTLNPISIKLYASLGYRKTGFADWRKGRFVLMEKTNLR